MTRLIAGGVVDAAGRPVAGAMVMVAGGTAPTPEVGLRTNAEGRFRLALPDGRFKVEAHHPDHGTARCEVTTRGGTEAKAIRLAFGGRGGSTPPRER